MVGRFPHPTNVFVDPEGLSIRPSALPSDKDSAGVSDRRPNTVSQAEVDRFLERHRDKLHKCHKCKIYFPTREYLQQHTAWHNNDAKVKCLHCSESFDDELSYASHKTSHTPQSPHVCPHCRGKFAHRLALKKHLVRCTNAPHHYTNNWGKVMDRSPARPQTSPSAPFYRDSPDGTENPSSVGSAPSLGSTNGSRSSGQDQNNSVASQFAAEPASDGIGTFQISVSSIDGPSDWVGENSVLLNSSPLPFLRSGEGEVEVRVMSRQHEVSQCSLKLAHIKTAIGVIRPAPLHLLNRFPNGRSKSRMGGMQFLQVKLVRPSLPTKKFQSGGEKSVLKKESIPSRQSSKDSRRCDQGTLPARRFVCANCGGSFPSKLGLVRHLQRRNCTK